MLIILAGLPGTGKTTIARELAKGLGAVHVRIDSIEQALRDSGTVAGPMDDTGYRVAYAVAEDNLRLGHLVIADSVNPIPLTRDAWVGVARRAGASFVEVEVMCSDRGEHRRRVESRAADISVHAPPSWAEVVARDDRAWDRERIVLDTSRETPAHCVAALRSILISMPETIEFKSNGNTASGYLVRPPSGSGPGVLVIQEWWGLDSGIKQMAERLGKDGFVALAPDLYHGELAGHDEMDKASHLMQSLPADRAARDMSGAVDYLAGHAAVTSDGIGVVGFCMGGMLSFIIAANRPDKVKAVVPFYGFPQGAAEPDWSKLTATISGHMAENDSFFTPSAARALEAKLRTMGKNVTLKVHPGTGHAFMGPHNALGTYNAEIAARIWPEVVSFLRSELAGRAAGR